MKNISKFKHPDKQPTDPLLARDPMIGCFDLNPDARQIYLRIIAESKPGVLLQCDQIAVQLAAQATALAFDSGHIGGLKGMYDALLLPELGHEYIKQIMSKD
jgi:hypothetical protein